jgi:hypothetical protein
MWQDPVVPNDVDARDPTIGSAWEARPTQILADSRSRGYYGATRRGFQRCTSLVLIPLLTCEGPRLDLRLRGPHPHLRRTGRPQSAQRTESTWLT